MRSAVSHWTRVEFASLLAREVRMGGLESAAAGETLGLPTSAGALPGYGD